MKIHWGIFAFGLFGCFAIFMIGLAVYASMQTNELVTEDYYEKELEFKEVLKKQDRTLLLTEQLSWKIENKEFIISFPKEVVSEISGEIIFFKPSSQKDDITLPFITSSNSFKIDISNYSSGMYKIKIDWKANNVEYYNDGQILIP